MNTKIFISTLPLSIWIVSSLFVSVEAKSSNAGTTSAQFLKIPLAARPIALGKTFTALADDANAIAWNPAGLSQSELSFAASQRIQTVLDSQGQFFAGTLPAFKKRGGIGLGVTLFSIKDIERRTSETAEPEGKFSSQDYAISIGYGHKFKNGFSLGGAFKIVQQQLQNYSANGFTGDIGLIYSHPNFPKLKFGIVTQNLGGDLKFKNVSEKFPSLNKVGVAYSMGIFTLVADGIYSNDSGLYGTTGLEVTPLSLLTLRVGYDTLTDKGLGNIARMGSGIGLRWKGIGLDYAFVPSELLGSTHFISLNFKYLSSSKR